MSIEKRWMQMLSYWQSWKETDEVPADITYALLACIGYLRRAGVVEEELKKLREIEVEIRHRLPSVLNDFQKFMDSSNLLERASQVLESYPDEDMLVSFYQDRDEAELALQLLTEYTEEENPENWEIVGNVRKFLWTVDDSIILNRQVVESLQELGSLEPVSYCEPDFFWWLPREEEGCYLPLHYRSKYISEYVTGYMSGEMKNSFRRHLLSCRECREQTENLEKTLLEECYQNLQYRPALAAADTVAIPDLMCYRWQDENDRWTIELYLDNAEASAEESLALRVISLDKEPVSWDKVRLLLGDLEIPITEGYGRCTRNQLELSIKKILEQGSSEQEQGRFILYFLDSGLKIPLLYRGESHV